LYNGSEMVRYRALVLRLLVLLAGIPLLSQPAMAKWDVRCADGTSCQAMKSGVVTGDHSCCHPEPCRDHPGMVSKSRCIVSATPPVNSTSPRVTAVAALELSPLFFELPGRIDFGAADRPTAWVDQDRADPPWRVILERAQGPRAPPVLSQA
jgi:hypothetical protein